ncbi:MAG: DUF4097 domain-containing protein [Ruminococcaceae bacterium]|nr:DUF4097 domain-containing protein [Oscillospiraceae bacterium]
MLKRLISFIIPCALLPLMLVGCSITHYSEPESYTVGSGSVSGQLRRLDIEWHSGSVTVKTHEGSEIILTESKVDRSDAKMRFRLRDGVLTVHPQASGVNVGILKSKTLEILIPQAQAASLTRADFELASADLKLEHLHFSTAKLSTASGNIKATDCSFDSLEATTASGNFTLQDCTVSSCEADTASGDISFRGSLREIEFDTASGDVSITTDITPTSIEGDTASGNIVLNLPAESEFECEYDVASGDANFNGFIGSHKKDRFVCGSGKNRYEFDTASGDITVNANET